MKVLTIFLRHGTQKFPDAQARLDDWFRRQLPGLERETVIVDTMLPHGAVEQSDSGPTKLGGDNSFSEFSAVDNALAWIGSRIWSYDLVHIGTAAFETLYTAYLERFDLHMLGAVAGRPACVGHVDCYNQPVRLLSYHSQHWLRTSCVFLPPTELTALRSLVSFRDRTRIFSGDAAQPFRSDAPLSENYRRYIYDWLTGGDIGQGVTWHSGFALSADTLAEFERKTMAILNEHLFAIRLRALGCCVVDATWLAAQLAAREAGDVRWTTGWREQLATRDRDALVIGQAAAANGEAQSR